MRAYSSAELSIFKSGIMDRVEAGVGVVALALLASACSDHPNEPNQSIFEEATKANQSDMMATSDSISYDSLTGDAANGSVVFAQCQSCHVTDAGVNMTGPSLADIVGRKSGSVDGFNYSPANANSGITWSEEQLYVFLESPQNVIPKTKMTFPGLRNAQQRADVIAYLKSAH